MNEISEKDREKNKPKKTRYFIIGYSRSGTTVTHLALMGHPNVCALNGELRPEPFFTKGISTFSHGKDPEDEKTKGYSAIFDAITLIRENEDTMAHGAKTACNSYQSAQDMVAAIQKYIGDLKIIIIIRNDIVAQFGSGIVGKKTGIMHSWYKGFEGRKVDKISINKWRFIPYAHNVNNMYAALSELKETNDVLEIYYEDLLADANSFYTKIFRFLGLPEVETTWLDSKKVLPPPEDYIKNYSALQIELSRIKSGKLPPYILFISKVISQLYWRLGQIIPRKQHPSRKDKHKL